MITSLYIISTAVIVRRNKTFSENNFEMHIFSICFHSSFSLYLKLSSSNLTKIIHARQFRYLPIQAEYGSCEYFESSVTSTVEIIRFVRSVHSAVLTEELNRAVTDCEQLFGER